jgi:hypothetical protein
MLWLQRVFVLNKGDIEMLDLGNLKMNKTLIEAELEFLYEQKSELQKQHDNYTQIYNLMKSGYEFDDEESGESIAYLRGFRYGVLSSQIKQLENKLKKLERENEK